MKNFLMAVLLTLLLFGIAFFLPAPNTEYTNTPPWQISVNEAGESQVFGLKPGISPLEEAYRLFGENPEIAIIAAPEETGSLEAYYDRISPSGIQGRLILTLESTPEKILALRKRSPKSEYMESATRRISLNPDDLETLKTTIIHVISFIPVARLNEAALLERFGEPAEKITLSETLTHYLYPERGLDIRLDAKKRDILQYVAPYDFDRQIRAPLLTTRQDRQD